MMMSIRCESDRESGKKAGNHSDGEYKKHCDIFGERNVLRDVEFTNVSLIFGMFGGSSRIECLSFESPSNGFLYRHSIQEMEGCTEGVEYIGCSVFAK